MPQSTIIEALSLALSADSDKRGKLRYRGHSMMMNHVAHHLVATSQGWPCPAAIVLAATPLTAPWREVALPSLTQRHNFHLVSSPRCISTCDSSGLIVPRCHACQGQVLYRLTHSRHPYWQPSGSEGADEPKCNQEQLDGMALIIRAWVGSVRSAGGLCVGYYYESHPGCGTDNLQFSAREPPPGISFQLNLLCDVLLGNALCNSSVLRFLQFVSVFLRIPERTTKRNGSKYTEHSVDINCTFAGCVSRIAAVHPVNVPALVNAASSRTHPLPKLIPPPSPSVFHHL